MSTSLAERTQSRPTDLKNILATEIALLIDGFDMPFAALRATQPPRYLKCQEPERYEILNVNG